MRPGTRELACDLCILGAGIAGLNALFAASRHLKAGERIILVDRDTGPAGMWNHVYGYVRLHQPHPMFTAGNIPWRGQDDAHHLATRAEVVDHLTHCHAELATRTGVETFFGHAYLHHEETEEQTHPVTVFCQRVSDRQPLTIRAKRLIKAFGYDIKTNPALSLTSQAVRSVSPDHCDLLGAEFGRDEGPIYVVGGGKTGMDTAHTLIKAYPRRAVHLLVGAGTMFINRDLVAPRGLRRHYGGATTAEVFLDLVRGFDGHNEDAVLSHMRRDYTVSLDDSCRRFMFGVLSPEENRAIREGAAEVIKDHLVDVVDGPSGPQMVLRSGERRAVEAGAVFVNTTGYVGDNAPPYEPYLSPLGRVLSVQPTSAVHFLSSQAAYFLTHLFLLDKLASTSLYEVDIPALRDASRDAFGPAAIALTLRNTLTCVSALPQWVLNENGLDFLLLFPPHRRLWTFAKLMTYRKLSPGHLEQVLDTVRERFDIRLGPLPHLTADPRSHTPS